jgi:hypothetical protein
MKSVILVAAAAFAILATSAPAFAGEPSVLPEPISISLLAGGIAAIAAVKHLRRK